MLTSKKGHDKEDEPNKLLVGEEPMRTVNKTVHVQVTRISKLTTVKYSESMENPVQSDVKKVMDTTQIPVYIYLGRALYLYNSPPLEPFLKKTLCYSLSLRNLSDFTGSL